MSLLSETGLLQIRPDLGLPYRCSVDWRPHAGEHLLLGKADHGLLSVTCYLCSLDCAAREREGRNQCCEISHDTLPSPRRHFLGSIQGMQANFPMISVLLGAPTYRFYVLPASVIG
jgi:hypothetical protein